MRYIGLDVHWGTTSVCILDENGRKEKSFTLRGHWQRVCERLEQERAGGPFTVCYEASNGYGYLYDRFSRLAERVLVAHPGQVRLIFRSKRKNDRIDAEKLAKLLYLDEVPPVYVPNAHVRAWRRLINFRQREIGGRTRIKNRLRGLLRRQGQEMPKNLWSKKGLAWLAALELPEMVALERDLLLDELALAQLRLKRIERELDRIAQTHPGVALLRTIPGVGPRTAEAVVAWIDDPRRFAKGHKIGAYFGLVPCQDASAGRNHLGHITRQGPNAVRGLLIEAAWQAIRRSPEVRRYYELVHRQDPDRRKVALVAAAHKLLRAMLAMLRKNEPWQPKAPATRKAA